MYACITAEINESSGGHHQRCDDTLNIYVADTSEDGGLNLSMYIGSGESRYRYRFCMHLNGAFRLHAPSRDHPTVQSMIICLHEFSEKSGRRGYVARIAVEFSPPLPRSERGSHLDMLLAYSPYTLPVLSGEDASVC